MSSPLARQSDEWLAGQLAALKFELLTVGLPCANEIVQEAARRLEGKTTTRISQIHTDETPGGCD